MINLVPIGSILKGDLVAGSVDLNIDQALIKFESWIPSNHWKFLTPGVELLVTSFLHRISREAHFREFDSAMEDGFIQSKGFFRPNGLQIHKTQLIEVNELGLIVDDFPGLADSPVIDVRLLEFI